MTKSLSAPALYRAQVAALPVRLGADGLEVLLITTRESRRWIVPKGWPMKDRRDHDAAATEAWQEAGVKGHVRKRPLGAYTYLKRLADRDEPCRVVVYRLDVEEEHDTWRERAQRERRWFFPAEAAELIEEPRLATMVAALGGAPQRAMRKTGRPRQVVPLGS